MLDVLTDRWKIREPIPFKKRVILFMMIEALKIPYNQNLAKSHSKDYKWLGVYSANDTAYNHRIYGLNNVRWPHEFCKEYTIDEVLEGFYRAAKKEADDARSI